MSTYFKNEIYFFKISDILFANNEIKSVTVVRMEVPCCGGIEYAAQKAIEQNGWNIDLKIVTLTADGRITS